MPKKPQTPVKTKKTKTAEPSPPIAAERPPRVLKAPSYRSFSLHKKITPATKPIPNSFHLFATAVRILRKHWKPFLGILAIYAVLNIALVKGFSAGASIADAKQAVEQGVSGAASKLLASTMLFPYLIGTASSGNNESGGVFQLILAIIVSLALLWTIRQAYAGQTVRIRDGFYRGMYPLIPVVLVLLVICLQLVPLVVGAFVYGLVTTIGVTGPEMLLWAFILFLLVLLSLYMLTSSLFALYIVCLPDMQPRQALRAARDLVRYRRWAVLRKVLFLPLMLFVLVGLVTIPFIIVLPVLAPWVFFLCSMTTLPVIHSYLYGLYRELL